MVKIVMGLGGAGLAALATVLAVALAGTGDATSTVSMLQRPAAEMSGPCDEAEHANDPRCTGNQAGERRDDDAAADDRADDPAGEDRADNDRREAGEDVRGPCDEAEHAGDPRCSGASASQPSRSAGDDGAADDDHGHRGRGGSGDSGSGHSGSGHGGEDRRGSNSGRG